MLKSGGRITGRDRVEGLLTGCEAVALQIMEDRCPGIGTVKALYELAQEVTRLDVTNVNGWYYLAMADYQLGFVRKGLRAIDRAIRLEPDGDDLLVLKGNLLVSNGCMEEALRCYEEAYEIHPEDSYYIMAGKACACMGNPIAAAQYYRKVSDPDTLKAFEIKLTKKKRI
jgi:tetratricopeptide (TPR) repeat protein